MFAAMKLTTGAEVGEIHPITLRYDGQEPCVPLKLTRIAAQQNMDVRVFFLQDARVIPANYRHVLVNPLMIDWMSFGANYKEVVSMAVDADSADGNAFVTEYAGGSNQISRANLYNPQWDEGAVAALGDAPIGVIDTLVAQGLITDSDWEETLYFNHPMLAPLLAQYLPVPDGVTQYEFYTCLECYEGVIDLEAWDAIGLADDLRERIIDPGAAAFDLLDQNPYLTRMYTTISPNEMTVDPIFRQHSGLPEVPNVRIAQRQVHCDGSATMTLPDGRVVEMPNSGIWPTISGAMPWDEDVDQAPAASEGALMSLVDNTELIDDLLMQWNQQNAGEDQLDDDAGCACSATPTGTGAGALASLLGLLGLRRRRRWLAT
jgi:MYXO-CTERM domain-containing protein